MLKNGGGTIINTVSSNSYKPTAYNGIYSASKHALAGMTKSIGQDYQDVNVYAVGVAPNTMQTNIAANASTTFTPEIGAKIGATTGPNIAATAEEIADAPLYFWLPGSYSAPPPVITALFAGLLTKVGIYAIMRIFTIIFHQKEIS